MITTPNVIHLRLMLGIRPPPYPAARALDIGCGPGLYVQALQRLGWNAFGLDHYLPTPSPTRTVFQADAHTLPLASESVHLVTCWHVLEHLGDPLKCLQEAYRVLCKGGELFIEVPYLDSLQAKVLGRKWLHRDLDRHRWHFTRPTLQQLLHRAGFRRLRIISIPNSPGWVHSLHLSPRWTPLGWAVDGLAALLHHGGVLRAWARKEK